MTEDYQPKESKAELTLRVVKAIEANNQFATLIGTGEILRYEPERGVWRREQEHFIRSEAERMEVRLEPRSFKNEVVTHIQDVSWTDPQKFNIGSENHEGYLCVQNGVLEIESGRILPFDPVYRFLNALNFVYPEKFPNRKPLFIQTLETTIPDDHDRQLVIDYLACTLWSTSKIHKMLWLIGTGDNGKDFLCSVIERLLGEENIASVTPQDLEQGRFAPARLYGKMLNVSSDIGDEDLSKSMVLKAASGGSLLNCERKGKDGFPFIYGGRFIFGANHLPETHDKSHAFMRRPIIIEMRETFFEAIPDDRKDDPHAHIKDNTLAERCTTSEELGLLLVYLVRRLRKIQRVGYIPNAPSVEDTQEAWESAVTFIPEFAKECCELGRDHFIRSPTLYSAYVRYCDSKGKKAVSGRKFPRAIETTCDRVAHKDQRVNGRTVKVFQGITLRESITRENLEAGQDSLPVADVAGNFPLLVNKFENKEENIVRYEDLSATSATTFDSPFARKRWAESEVFFENLSKSPVLPKKSLSPMERFKAFAEATDQIPKPGYESLPGYCPDCKTAYGDAFRDHVQIVHAGSSPGGN